MSLSAFASYRPIDSDTHILEPADLWTARLPSKWRDRAPQIMKAGDKEIWVMDGKGIGAPGAYAMAGWDGVLPDFPDGYADVVESAGNAKARLAYMDGEGIHAAVLYPNVGGFASDRFIRAGEPSLDARLRARLQRLPGRVGRRSRSRAAGPALSPRPSGMSTRR